jgi:hypothetical protein
MKLHSLSRREYNNLWSIIFLNYVMRLPVKNPSVVILISKLDSGFRKGNTCLKSAKFFEQIVLFKPFEILPKEFSQGVFWTFGSQPVLNPAPEGFRGTYLTGKHVICFILSV